MNAADRTLQLAELAILLHPCQPRALRDHVWDEASAETRELALDLQTQETERRAARA